MRPVVSGGVSVLLIVNLDSETGAACSTKAVAQGIKIIDYDRLTLGGGASYYVSFDNVAVGTKIGEGLVKCMQDNGNTTGDVVLLNGSPTDNNATLFKQGYEKVIKDAGYTIVDDQSVPDWDNTKAGTIFEQIYTEDRRQVPGRRRRPTTVSVARRSPSSPRTVSPARSRSPARTRPTRVCSACCSAPSA